MFTLFRRKLHGRTLDIYRLQIKRRTRRRNLRKRCREKDVNRSLRIGEKKMIMQIMMMKKKKKKKEG